MKNIPTRSCCIASIYKGSGSFCCASAKPTKRFTTQLPHRLHAMEAHAAVLAQVLGESGWPGFSDALHQLQSYAQ